MFKKIYFSIDSYKIFENSNSRFVDESYPLYIQFLQEGNLPSIEIDASVADILEVVDNNIQYKSNYETILLNKAKIKAKDTLYSNRVAKDLNGFTFNGINISTDLNSQSILANAYVGAKNGLLEEGTKWKTENSDIDLSKEQVIAIYEAVFNFIKSNYTIEINKRALIDNCTTINEVENIDLSI